MFDGLRYHSLLTDAYHLHYIVRSHDYGVGTFFFFLSFFWGVVDYGVVLPWTTVGGQQCSGAWDLWRVLFFSPYSDFPLFFFFYLYVGKNVLYKNPLREVQ